MSEPGESRFRGSVWQKSEVQAGGHGFGYGLGNAIRPKVRVYPVPAGIQADWDTPVAVRDGATLRVNVFRPSSGQPAPVIMSAHPCGKDKSPRAPGAAMALACSSECYRSRHRWSSQRGQVGRLPILPSGCRAGIAGGFPGYHGLGDTVDKIDFANMARVDKGVAAGIVELANRSDPPGWSDSKAAAPYRKGR
jgi:hypothetical protein